MASSTLPPVLAAIDVGTNAVRLELARPDADGALETLHQERDPIRPGEGVFATGAMPEETADRLLATLRRYAALCKRHKALVRAVATSALRESRNRDAIVQRVRDETGLDLEVVSGKEEARLICLGVLHRKPPGARSLLIDIGGGSTEVALTTGEQPDHLWSLALGAVRLTEVFEASQEVSSKHLRLMRSFVAETVRKTLPEKKLSGAPKGALGSSGTINAVVAFASGEDGNIATVRQISQAVNALAAMPPERRRKRFDPRRADIIVSGALILEGAMKHLGVETVSAVNRGLRDGLLVDLLYRQDVTRKDHSLTATALELGRRFFFDEKHCRQVARLAVALFDALANLHHLPLSARPYLEVAALLHDIGTTVSYERHHKHTYYLIRNADIPGLSERERALVALVARYHRRSVPKVSHPGMAGLPASEARTVRKLATLLRVANALDCSHQQPIKSIRASAGRDGVTLHLNARQPMDLELWTVDREAAYFRSVFGKRLLFHVGK
ncbi:exopolyphosphatase / guanosine-5'-triphosphate,3'-diphosphate pyrophosphatase [Stigmatella aurantiaca]|uniref:Exopolyphosphatase / guanosine-5'-triphosphate,3'-diphosphate pyrophosphatase n=1 Tax=Stigmatella aurantiaca TaxID=41 RepID=A0A1H7ZQT6_STIAU|nr:Ppx/GppA phosphatase family protein [Stigmatella aurantiaca]SEM59918.1 exopolyphosphatase / guanosine-5'-triphosphate,3'-diphosphate pyrophosphatase [Stigmatella aurantiaca]